MMKNALARAALCALIALIALGTGYLDAAAQAPRLTPAACGNLARLAWTFATIRDVGADREKYRALVRRMNDGLSDEAMVLIMGELDLAYDRGLPPEFALYDALRRCAAGIERQDGGRGGSGGGEVLL